MSDKHEIKQKTPTRPLRGSFDDRRIGFRLCTHTDIVLSLLSYVAETERRNIRERQREGIEAAKRRGVKFGRPRIGQTEEIAKCLEQIGKGILSVESAAKICQMSATTIRRRMVLLRQNMI